MKNSIPIALLFDGTSAELLRRIGALIESDDEINHYHDATSGSPFFRLLNCGMEFRLSVDASTINMAEFDKIFLSSDVPSADTMLTICLGENLSGGQFVAPIAMHFLTFAANLATNLGAKAVAWMPSQLLSDTTYFATTVDAYAKGEAFPVLSTIKLRFSDDALHTTGLHWFSGQELDLKGEGLPQAEMARRAVRIIHDIATNGAVMVQHDIPDLDQGKLVRLAPSAEGDRVFARIIGQMDHSPV